MMRLRIAASLLLFPFLAFSALAGAQAKKAKRLPHLPPTTPQGLEGGFWRTDIDFDSELHLRNVLSKQALDVTPEIFFADGAEYDLPPVHLEPAGVFTVDITAALQDPDVPKSIKPHISKYGMVGISYQWSWPAVMACIQNTDQTVSLSAGSSPLASKDVVHKTPEDIQPQVIRSSWWHPTKDSDELIAIGNTSLAAKQVQVRVSDASGALIASKQLHLPSHQSSVLRMNDLLSGSIDPGSAGDVTVLYSGAPHAVVASASIEDTKTGFSVTPSMVEAAPTDTESAPHSVTLHAAGLMMGKMDPTMGFPPGLVFMPYAVLHNISGHSVTAALSLTSNDSSGSPATRLLDSIPLASGQTAALDMSRYFTSGTPLPNGFGNLSVAYTGKYGDILFDVGSADQSENYIFPVIPAAEAPTTSKIFAFWQLDGATSTMISVWNYSATKPQDATLTLYYSGGQYRIPLHLLPRQTYNLDLMDLMRYGKPDADGKLLPEDVFSGSATLTGPNGELDKMTIVTSSSTYNVHTATCFPMCIDCGGLTSLYLDPDNIIIITQGWGQAYGYYTSSYGGPYAFTGGNWSSSNPSVAPIYSSGSIYGQAPGWANMLAQMSAPPGGMTCYQSDEGVCADEDFEGAGQATVQVPTSLPAVGSVYNHANTSCTGGQQGWSREAIRQLEDQNGQAIKMVTQITEAVTVVTNGLQLPAPHQENGPTDANGQIGDILDFCSPVCPSNNSTTYSQTITNNAYQLGTYVMLKKCTSVTINGN